MLLRCGSSSASGLARTQCDRKSATHFAHTVSARGVLNCVQLPMRTAKTKAKRANLRQSVLAFEEAPTICRRGWLEKRTKGVLSRWQRRWWVAEGHYLRYFYDERETDVVAAIDLNMCEVVGQNDSETDLAMVKLLLGGDDDGQGERQEQYELRAASAEDANEWRSTLIQLQLQWARKRAASHLPSIAEGALADDPGCEEQSGDSSEGDNDEDSENKERGEVAGTSGVHKGSINGNRGGAREQNVGAGAGEGADAQDGRSSNARDDSSVPVSSPAAAKSSAPSRLRVVTRSASVGDVPIMPMPISGSGEAPAELASEPGGISLRRFATDGDGPVAGRTRGRSGSHSVAMKSGTGTGPTLSAKALTELAVRMASELEIRDRRWHLRTFRDCFLGSDAAAWLRAHYKHADGGLGGTARDEPGKNWLETAEAALETGRRMVTFGHVFHVSRGHDFEDARLFYRFSPAVTAQARAMHSATVLHGPEPGSPLPLASESAALEETNALLKDLATEVLRLRLRDGKAQVGNEGNKGEAISEMAGATGATSRTRVLLLVAAAGSIIAALACVRALLSAAGVKAGDQVTDAETCLQAFPHDNSALWVAVMCALSAGAAATMAFRILPKTPASAPGVTVAGKPSTTDDDTGGSSGAPVDGSHASGGDTPVLDSSLLRQLAAGQGVPGSGGAGLQHRIAATDKGAQGAADEDGADSGGNRSARAVEQLRQLKEKIMQASAGAGAGAGTPTPLPVHFTDQWLLSVMSKKHRSFNDSVNKCRKALQALGQYKAAGLLGPLPKGGLVAGSAASHGQSQDLSALVRQLEPVLAPMMARCGAQLSRGSMYWAGYDRNRRPVLWVRPKLKQWRGMDREKEVLAHVALIEIGLQLFLPPGETQFVLVADAAGLGFAQFDASLMRSLLKLMTTAYPDRVARIAAGPVNALVKSVHSLLRPLLPAAVKSKIVIMDNPSLQMLEFVDADLVPHFFGGVASHEFSGNSNGDGEAGVHAEGAQFSLTHMVAAQWLEMQRQSS